jgi:hypothetical protein
MPEEPKPKKLLDQVRDAIRKPSRLLNITSLIIAVFSKSKTGNRKSEI